MLRLTECLTSATSSKSATTSSARRVRAGLAIASAQRMSETSAAHLTNGVPCRSGAGWPGGQSRGGTVGSSCKLCYTARAFQRGFGAPGCSRQLAVEPGEAGVLSPDVGCVGGCTLGRRSPSLTSTSAVLVGIPEHRAQQANPRCTDTTWWRVRGHGETGKNGCSSRPDCGGRAYGTGEARTGCAEWFSCGHCARVRSRDRGRRGRGNVRQLRSRRGRRTARPTREHQRPHGTVPNDVIVVLLPLQNAEPPTSPFEASMHSIQPRSSPWFVP
jgi:hypothetical protein